MRVIASKYGSMPVKAKCCVLMNAGGLGILVGDGKLPQPGSEQIIESYYRWPARARV